MSDNTFCINFDPTEDNYRDPDNMINDFFRKMYGDLAQNDIRRLKEDYSNRNNARLENAKKKAMAILRNTKRPVRRGDMLYTMEVSLINRMTAFEGRPAPDTALMLVATIICRNLLLDGPLHEEED